MRKKNWKTILIGVLVVNLFTGSVLPSQATEAGNGEAESQLSSLTETQVDGQAESQTETQKETETGTAPSKPSNQDAIDKAEEDLKDITDKVNSGKNELDQLGQNINNAQDNVNNLNQGAAATQNKVDSLTKNYNTLAGKVTAIQKQINEKTKEIEEKQAQIDAKENQIEEKKREISVTMDQITEKTRNIAEQETDIADQYAAMKLRIQYMYENVTAGQYLEMLLQSESFIDFLNRVEYLSSIIEYDTKKRTEFADALAVLKAQKEELDQQKAALVDQKDGLEKEQEGLVADRADLDKEKIKLEALKKDLKNQQNQVSKQMDQSVKELEEIFEQLSQSNADLDEAKDKYALQQQYYEELLEKQYQATLELAKQKAIAAAEESGGSLKEEDSEIDYDTIFAATADDITLLASIIYCESRGEPYEGQLAVGYVVMNRVRSKKFPNTIKDVIYAPGQFSPVGSGLFTTVVAGEMNPYIQGKVTESCYRAAREVINGTSNVGESLFFRTWKPVPQLIENLEANGVTYFIIKNHVFYYSWVKYR